MRRTRVPAPDGHGSQEPWRAVRARVHYVSPLSRSAAKKVSGAAKKTSGAREAAAEHSPGTGEHRAREVARWRGSRRW